MLIYPTFVNMKRTLYIPFVVGMLFISLSCGAGHTPKSAVKHFFSTMEDGEYDKTLSYTTLSEDADYELYYALHFRSSGMRSGRLGTPALEE